MNVLLLFLILITPIVYTVSPYALLLVIIAITYLFLKDVRDPGNKLLLLVLLTILFSSISIAGVRLYDLSIIVYFAITCIRKRIHLSLPYSIFPFLFLVIIVAVSHSGYENIAEAIRYIICILLFVTAYNYNYDIDKISDKILLLVIANIYYAFMVFLLNTAGKIIQYNGVVSSNIFVLSSDSEIRLSGFFSDPNKYMAFCLALIFITELWIKKSKQKNLILFILCISSLISLSRTAILSILFYVFFKLIKTTYKKNKILSVLYGSAIIFVIVIIILSPDLLNRIVNSVYVTSARLMGRQHTLSINANLQSDNRTKIWEVAIDLIVKHPILGYGWGSIRELLPYPTHNTILELLMDSGIIGFLCYLVFMKKLLFNKYYEYTIPFIWVPLFLLDLGGYRILFLLLGLMCGQENARFLPLDQPEL